MQNRVDKPLKLHEEMPLPKHHRRPQKPVRVPLSVVKPQPLGDGIVAAFEVERLGKVRNFAFTVDDLLGLVRRDYDIANKKSRRTVKYPLGHVQAFFREKLRREGRPKLGREVTAEDIEDYLIDRRTEKILEDGTIRPPAKEATIKVELAMLKRGFHLAVRLRRGLTLNDIPAFPVIAADTLTVRHGFLRSDQVHEVMSFLHPDVADLVEFLFVTGWRFGEAAKLKWSNIEDDRIWIATSKSGHPRAIPIAGDELIAIMQRRLQRRRNDWVFHREGKPINDFRWRWQRALEQAGFADRKWIVHDLRRSAIRRMILAGADQKSIMEWTGHRTDSVFRRYMISDMDRMVQVAEMVNAKEREKAGPARLDPLQTTRAFKWERRR
jgi:integrase